MSTDVLTLADRLWRGEVSTTTMHPVDHVGGFVEITDGVGFTPSFANVSAFATGDGLVLVDTGSLPLASVVHADIRRWSAAPLHTAVYSHGHIDHVFGVPVWEEEARERGWKAPEVIAHHALPARFDRYIFTAGYNTIINRRQFGFTDLNWPTTYRYPDRTYHEVLELSVGGSRLHAPAREGRDRRPHGDLAGQLPGALLRRPVHLGLPQRGEPAEGAALSARVGPGAAEDAHLGGGVPPARPRAAGGGGGPGPPGPDRHGRSARFAGRPDPGRHERRRAAGRRHPLGAAAGRAGGAPVSAAGLRRARVHRAHGLAPVRRVVGRQSRHPQAGAASGPWPPSWPRSPGGRASWPIGRSSCWPAPPAPSRRRRASADHDLRLAGHLAESAWLASPADGAVQRARQQVFAARAERATSTMARGVFNWAANESVPEVDGDRRVAPRPLSPMRPSRNPLCCYFVFFRGVR